MEQAIWKNQMNQLTEMLPLELKRIAISCYKIAWNQRGIEDQKKIIEAANILSSGGEYDTAKILLAYSVRFIKEQDISQKEMKLI